MNKLLDIIGTITKPYPDMNLRAKTVNVLYIRNDAFTMCDCGKEFALHNFSGKIYSGKCLCGKSYKLVDNKLYDALDKK